MPADKKAVAKTTAPAKKVASKKGTEATIDLETFSNNDIHAINMDDPAIYTQFGIEMLPENLGKLSGQEIRQLSTRILIMNALVESQRERVFEELRVRTASNVDTADDSEEDSQPKKTATKSVKGGKPAQEWLWAHRVAETSERPEFGRRPCANHR